MPKQHVIELIYGRGKFVGNFKYPFVYKAKTARNIRIMFYSIQFYLIFQYYVSEQSGSDKQR
jgi:hypothetical protein